VFIPSRRKRREFEAAWIERAERSTPKGIKAVYKWWREDKRRPKPSAARWIDWRLGQIPFDPQTDQFPHYDVTVGGVPQVPVRVWMDRSGQITSRFGRSVDDDIAYDLMLSAHVKVTEQQLAAGVEPWFPHLIAAACKRGDGGEEVRSHRPTP
jgi:hypothetical protein